MKKLITLVFSLFCATTYAQVFPQADSITVFGSTEKVYIYENDENTWFRNFVKRKFFVDPNGASSTYFGINAAGNGFALYSPVWGIVNDSVIQRGNWRFLTGQNLSAINNNYVATYNHSTQTISFLPPQWGRNGNHFYISSGQTLGIANTGTTADIIFDMGTDFKQQKFALLRAGNSRMGLGMGTGTMRMYTTDGNSGGIEWGQIAFANGTTFTRQMQLDNSSRLIVGGTASPTDQADKIYAIGNVKATQFLRPGLFTFTQAGLLTPSNGDIMYVTSAGGVFSEIGFWGYKNGAWVLFDGGWVNSATSTLDMNQFDIVDVNKITSDSADIDEFVGTTKWNGAMNINGNNVNNAAQVNSDSCDVLNPAFQNAPTFNYQNYTATGTLNRELAHYWDGTSDDTLTTNTALPDETPFFVKNNDASLLLTVLAGAGQTMNGDGRIYPGEGCWFQRHGTVIERITPFRHDYRADLSPTTDASGDFTITHNLGTSNVVYFLTPICDACRYSFRRKTTSGITSNTIVIRVIDETTGLALASTSLSVSAMVQRIN